MLGWCEAPVSNPWPANERVSSAACGSPRPVSLFSKCRSDGARPRRSAAEQDTQHQHQHPPRCEGWSQTQRCCPTRALPLWRCLQCKQMGHVCSWLRIVRSSWLNVLPATTMLLTSWSAVLTLCGQDTDDPLSRTQRPSCPRGAPPGSPCMPGMRGARRRTPMQRSLQPRGAHCCAPARRWQPAACCRAPCRS
jgi:hypothetical protein